MVIIIQEQENLSLYDTVTPGPMPGVWQFKTSQQLIFKGQEIAGEKISAEQSIIVEGPMFSVEREMVVQRTPLPDSQGSYTDVMPHIVLKGAVGFGRAGFAVLLLKEEELVGCVRETTVEEYLKPRKDTRIPAAACCGKDTLIRPCTCLRLTGEFFAAVAPEETELSFLTHYRQVYIGDKPEMDLDGDGIFTVVLSNRIPQYSQGDCTAYQAHLVSLAGFYSCLAGMEKGCSLELISMDHWSFSVTGKRPDSFRKICGRLKKEGAVSDMLLKLPEKEGMEKAGNRLREGYVPMLYHMRTGEEGLCWSRSPFTPIKIESRIGRKPFETADSALCYDREDSVFDVSLAAAFEAGRMAALENGGYLDALLQLRTKAQSIVDGLVEKKLIGLEKGENYQESLTGILLAHELEQKTDLGDRQNKLHVAAAPRFPEGTKEEVEAMMRKETESLFPLLEECGQPVAEWLARLLLFYPLSYDSLLPHEALLPKESVRFFYVDEAYRQALYDGAVSIGLYSERQSLLNRLIRSYLYEASRKASLAYRASLYGQQAPAGNGNLSGFLVRAALVAYWPSVSVEARNHEGKQLAILRMEHLGPDVLLTIFDGTAETVVVNEPEESLAIKIDTEEYPAFKDGTGVLDLEPDGERSLIAMIAEKQQKEVGEIGSAAFALHFLTTGERTIFGEGVRDE